jgi:hypothetical protein
MERRGNTSDGIWSTGKGGSLVRITAAVSFGVFRENGAHIFAHDANLFGLQSNGQKRKIIYIFPGSLKRGLEIPR